MSSPTAAIKKSVADCVILIDTREKTPWTFANHETERVGIKVGDYSIRDADGRSWAPGNDNSIMIERKSIDDLVGSFTFGRERFGREWIKVHEMNVERYYLIVEGDMSDLVNGNYVSKATPSSIIQSIVSWELVYGYHVWMAGKPQWAARLAESVLEKHVTGILKREGDDG